MVDNRKWCQAYFTQIHSGRRKIKQSYRHLIMEDRIIRKTLLQEGESRKYIAEKLERDLSSIMREMKRNSGQRGYRPKQAQRKYEERKGRGKVTKSPFEIILYIEEKRKEEYSPEQISGRRPLDIRLRKGALTESRQMAEDSIGKKISGCRSNTTR